MAGATGGGQIPLMPTMGSATTPSGSFSSSPATPQSSQGMMTMPTPMNPGTMPMNQGVMMMSVAADGTQIPTAMAIPTPMAIPTQEKLLMAMPAQAGMIMPQQAAQPVMMARQSTGQGSIAEVLNDEKRKKQREDPHGLLDADVKLSVDNMKLLLVQELPDDGYTGS